MFPIISLHYFQNYLKRKLTNIFKKSIKLGHLFSYLIKNNSLKKKKRLINLFKGSFVN